MQLNRFHLQCVAGMLALTCKTILFDLVDSEEYGKQIKISVLFTRSAVVVAPDLRSSPEPNLRISLRYSIERQNRM